MFLKMEKCLQNYAGVFWEELRRKDTVKPKANIFTNAFFFWVCGGFLFCITVGQLFAGMNRSDLWYSCNHSNKKKKKGGEDGGRLGNGLQAD